MNLLLMKPLEFGDPCEMMHPDLGLGWLATAARERGHSVRLLLNHLDRIGNDRFRSILQQAAPDVVGIKVFVNSVRKAVRTIGLIREALPEATILIARG